ALFDAPPSPQSQAAAENQAGSLLSAVSGHTGDLPFQAAPVLFTLEEASYASPVRTSGKPLPQGSSRSQPDGFAQLVQLGQTLRSWQVEIATMWRFTRNNGITEGFHTKMEVLQRQAYGFRNFNNYRLRVKIMCS